MLTTNFLYQACLFMANDIEIFIFHIIFANLNNFQSIVVKKENPSTPIFIVNILHFDNALTN
jgi:hypothetical protein